MQAIMKTTKQLLNEVAFRHLDRKTQEELEKLRAIAEAAAIVAQNKELTQLAGGQDLVKLLG